MGFVLIFGLPIVLPSLATGAIGVTASFAGPRWQQRRAARLEREMGLSEAGIVERE